MRHSVEKEKFGVRLRPVRMDDAAFIVWIRNLSHAKGRVGDSYTDTAGQETWLKKYFERDGDYYFIVETVRGVAVGAYGIYDVANGTGESGRWIIRPGVPAGIPSAIIGFEIAFHILKLKELRARTVSTNQPVLSLNLKMGFREVKVERGEQNIGGQPVDMVHFLLTPEAWAGVAPRFDAAGKVAEHQIRQWEQTRNKL